MSLPQQARALIEKLRTVAIEIQPLCLVYPEECGERLMAVTQEMHDFEASFAFGCIPIKLCNNIVALKELAHMLSWQIKAGTYTNPRLTVDRIVELCDVER